MKKIKRKCIICGRYLAQCNPRKICFIHQSNNIPKDVSIIICSSRPQVYLHEEIDWTDDWR